MRLKQHITESSCPIRTKTYGGIITGGGYSSHTEYEIGAQQIAEALHCILGSLGRDVGLGMGRAEAEHIKEEFGIIERAIKEYSRKLYSDRLMPDYSKYGEQSVKSIRKVSPKLKSSALKLQRQLGKDLDPETRGLALACYDMLVDLANEMLLSVVEYPDYVLNAFSSVQMELALSRLKKAKDKWLRKYK